MAALRAGKSDTTSSTPNAPEIIKSSYTPIGRVDIAAIRAQAQQQQQQQQPEPKSESSYVGTSGYQPVQLSKPKPISSMFGPTTTTRRGGTIAPMPAAPPRESKVIGGASKNFATDASGKTPSQLWAERKAREKGMSVTPNIAPQTPLPTMSKLDVSPPGGYVEDSAEVIGTPVSGGVAAMRERFARQSLDDEQPSLPISPNQARPVGRSPTAMRISPPSVPSPPSPPAAPSPPPISMSSKPSSAKTYQSLDDVVAAGAGAGIGLGVGAMASQALHREEPEEEEHDDGGREQVGYSPVVTRTHETWDTTRRSHEESDQEEVHTEQEHEPRERSHEEEQHEQSSHTETGAKTAIVLFDYEAQEENEINLSEGQIITNIEFIDDVPFPPPSNINLTGMVGR